MVRLLGSEGREWRHLARSCGLVIILAKGGVPSRDGDGVGKMSFGGLIKSL